MLDVSFVIPAQLTSDILFSCLASVKNQKTTFSFETIVILNERSSLSLDSFFHVLRAPIRNASSARNLGLEIAQGEHIVFLDGDTVLDEGWLERMMVRMKEGVWSGGQGRIVTVSANPGSLFSEFREASSRLHQDGLSLSSYDLPVLNSAACIYRHVPGLRFDQALFGAEDVDLSWRILQTYSQGFFYDDVACADCFYSPESFLNYFRRNFRLGRALRLVAQRHDKFIPGLFHRFLQQNVLQLKIQWKTYQYDRAVALGLRFFASLSSFIGLMLGGTPLADWERPSGEKEMLFLNGVLLAEDERLFSIVEKLKLVDLKKFRRRFFSGYTLLRNQKLQSCFLGHDDV